MIQRLLRQWDEALTPVLSQPKAVATDLTHPLRVGLTRLFTNDSPYVRDLTTFLTEGYVSRDAGTRPGPEGTVQATTLLRLTDAPDPDHVRFVFCGFNDGAGFTLSTGAPHDPGVGITQGTGEASRVDGAWRLYRLQQLSFTSKPVGTSNPCPQLAGK